METAQPRSHINIRDAIRLNDHIRIRNGSPGSNERRNNTLESKRSFDEEMQDKGLITEIQDLNRFNYVLVTRSSPTNVDQERFINELAERMSGGGSSNTKSRE
jgi:hypothetical protein